MSRRAGSIRMSRPFGASSVDQARTRRARNATRSAGARSTKSSFRRCAATTRSKLPAAQPSFDGRKLDREVRAHEARACRPIDRHHLERLPEARPQDASRRARAGAEIDRARRAARRRVPRRPRPARVPGPPRCAARCRARTRRATPGPPGKASRPARGLLRAPREPPSRACAGGPTSGSSATCAQAGAYPFPKMSLKLTINSTPSRSTNPAVWTAASMRGLTFLRMTDSIARNTARPPSSAGTGNRLKRPR